jgi:hypothetical protein
MIGKIDTSPVLNSAAQDLSGKKTEGLKPNLSDAPPTVVGANALTEVDYRLVIEKSPKTGGYVYKTLNSFTGEVVSQRPAEDVFKLAGSAQYAPGLVVSAKA